MKTTLVAQTYRPNMGENRPPANHLGWCHQCGVVQTGADSQHIAPRWLSSYSPGEKLWCCVTPGCEEPWGIGVWPGSPCPSCLPVNTAQAAGKVVTWDGICRAEQYGMPDCQTGEPSSARSAPE